MTPGPLTCAPGTQQACNTVTCGPGITPTATCTSAATLGPCTCPGASGGTAGTVSAGKSGPTGGIIAGVAGQSGTPATSAGVAGTPPAAVGGSGTAGVAGPVAGTPAVVAEDPNLGSWPMMGYDTNNNYHNPKETLLSVATAPMLKEKWRAKVGGYPPGTPIVAGGRVFVTSTAATSALSLADGTILWKRMDLGGTASVAYSEGFIYVHTATTDLYKLNPADGTNVWGPVKTFPVKDCDGESSPIVAAGMVFVGRCCGPMEISDAPADLNLAQGGVEAFDAATGKPVWTYLTIPKGTNENGAMVWSTVSVDLTNKMLFAGTGNNYSVQGANSDSIHAVDLMTGMRLWKKQVHDNDTWSISVAVFGPDTDFGANPILAEIDGKQIVAAGDKGAQFHAFDRKTGTILWQRKDLSTSRNQANGGVLMNGAFDGKYFYVVSNQPPEQAQLHALDPRKDGADAWPPRLLNKLTWGAPSLANGVLVVPSDDDLLVLNAMTGEMLAKFNTGGTIAAGAPAIVDGNIVVASGLDYELAPTTKPNDQVICYAVPGASSPPVTKPTGMAGGPAPTFVPGSPTFAAIYTEIIANKGCTGGPSCHASSAGGSLVMNTKADAYTALVGVKAMGAPCATSGLTRVVASDPANSLFLDKVAAATPKCGGHMPPGGDLTAAEIKQITDWIAAGAMNN